MEEIWTGYKTDLRDRVSKDWLKTQYVGRDGDRVQDEYKLPLTYEGLRRYAWDIGVGDIHDYFVNDSARYPEFSIVCTRIKNEIRENQITGGVLGVFNTSITQRLNGLTEKTDITSNGKQINTSQLIVATPKMIKDIGKMLDDEV